MKEKKKNKERKMKHSNTLSRKKRNFKKLNGVKKKKGEMKHHN